MARTCDQGTYFSMYSFGCADCPSVEPISQQCENVHQEDVQSCLQNCVLNGKSIGLLAKSSYFARIIKTFKKHYIL